MGLSLQIYDEEGKQYKGWKYWGVGEGQRVMSRDEMMTLGSGNCGFDALIWALGKETPR